MDIEETNKAIALKDLEEAKKAITVMQAYVDGAEIQARSLAYRDRGWATVGRPNWNWLSQEYRVAPKPTIRPFTAVEAAAHLGVRLLRSDGSKWELAQIASNRVVLAELRLGDLPPVYETGVLYTALATEFKFENGEPCGVLISQP